MLRGWRVLGPVLVVVAGLVAAACSGGELDSGRELPPVSAVAEPSTSATSSTVEEESGPDVEALEAQWQRVWSVADPAELEQLADVVPAEADRVVLDEVNPLDYPFEVTTYPSITIDGVGATIEDCFLRDPDVQGERKTRWVRGRGTWDPDSATWTLAELQLVSADGCVPAELAEEVLADYEAYWQAQQEYWNPAQPDHPGIEATMTGPQLELIQGLVEKHAQDGWHLIDNPRLHPEIVAVCGSPVVEVVIYDCQEADVDAGVFDSSGARQEGIPPVDEGQRDLLEIELIQVNGEWKVVALRGDSKVDCEFAPTDASWPIV